MNCTSITGGLRRAVMTDAQSFLLILVLAVMLAVALALALKGRVPRGW